MVSNLVTIVGGFCKRRAALRDAQFAKIKEDLENGVHRSGRGLNQETNLKWDYSRLDFDVPCCY